MIDINIVQLWDFVLRLSIECMIITDSGCKHMLNGYFHAYMVIKLFFYTLPVPEM